MARILLGGASMIPLIMVCAVAGAATPEEPPSLTSMALDEAIAYARVHQPSLAAARARIDAAMRDVDVARADWQPSIGALAELVGSTANNSSATQLTGGPAGVIDVVRIGATAVRPPGDLSFRPYASTLVGVGLRQEVYDFGRIAAQRVAAEAVTEVARQRGELARLAIEYAVAESFYAVLAAKAALVASTEALQRIEVYRDFAKRAVDAGLRPPIELTRAEADLARYRVGTIRARAGVEIARSVLAATIGAPDAQIDAKEAAGPAVTALPTPGEVAQRVATTGPQVRMSEALVRAQHAQTKALDVLWRPNLLVSAALTSRAGGAQPTNGDVPAGDGFIPSVANYSVGLVLSWPVWEPGTRARVESARAREVEAGAELAATRNAAVHAAQQELRRVETALEALGALEASLAAAKANNAQADARYRAGLGTSTELADAEAVRVDAEFALVSGRFQLMTARAALARVLAEEP